MGTLKQLPEKFSKQKGQGMLEYALIISFVAAMFIIVFPEGLGDSINSTFDNAAELLETASESDGDFGGSGGGGSSSSSGGTLLGSLLGGDDSNSDNGNSGSDTNSSAEQRLDYIASEEYKLEELDWPTLKKDMKRTFDTIIKTKDPNRAIASEYNLFFQLAAMTNGKQEYIYTDENGQSVAVGWNEVIGQIKGQTTGLSTSSYVKKDNPNEKLWISRDDTKNSITMTYQNGDTTKEFSIYAEDGTNGTTKNRMTFSNVVKSGETITSIFKDEEAMAAFRNLASEANVYTSGVWIFKNN